MKLTAILCLLPLAAMAAELPEPVLPAGVGVNIHFVQGHQRDLDLIAAAGFKFVRMDFAWEGIEKKKGEYDWSAYDELTENLEAHGLRAIYILDYSHRLYEEQVDSKNALKTAVPQRDTASPQHPESIAAYANWAAAAVKHYHGRHIIWEIWNEPNGFFWKPKPDAGQYSALAVAAGKAIREADPEATLIGPALSGFQPPYMETFLKSGVLQYLDAVSVHPYRSPKKWPETAAGDYQKLREKIEQYAPTAGKKKLPIISGEWGYSTKIGDVSLETQAAYLVRQQLFNLLEGIPLSIWYDWKNDGTDPHEVEHNFGTVTDNLEPKPSYSALKIMTHELAGFRIERRLATDTNDFVLLCVNSSGGTKLAAWTVGEPHTAKLSPPIKSSNLSGIKGTGESFTVQVENGKWLLELEQLPKYITVK
jgi:hypothetical protein